MLTFFLLPTPYLIGIPNDLKNPRNRSRNKTFLNAEFLVAAAASSRESCCSTCTSNSAKSLAESALPSIGDRASRIISALSISSGISLAGGRFPAITIGVKIDHPAIVTRNKPANLETFFAGIDLLDPNEDIFSSCDRC